MDFLQSLDYHCNTGLFSKSQKSEKIANFRTFLLKHLRHLTGVQYHSETNYVIYYQVIKPKKHKIEKKYSKEQKLAKSQKKKLNFYENESKRMRLTQKT